MHASLEEMSVWGLITGASLVVQAVMLALVLASLASWYLIIHQGGVLRRREREAAAFRSSFRTAQELGSLRASVADASGLAAVFAMGYDTFTQARRQPGGHAQITDAVDRMLQVAVAEQEVALERGLTVLATVGSVSPYVGLFGTVWGIMNAFLGLSGAAQATLSTVAPGIAEALIATAIGLVAAIPAVMAYNRFAARCQRLVADYFSFGNELQARLQRIVPVADPVAAAA